MSRRFAIGLLVLGMAPAAALAQPAPAAREAPPAAFTRALQCRALTDPQERLGCYDREVAALEQAERSSQIRVVDAQQVRRTRRTLFGLNLTDFNPFGGRDDDPMNEINATIQSTRQTNTGRWLFVLEDGARWLQHDTDRMVSDPRPGQAIRIRRAAMGSFLANINGQRAIRVRRQN